MPTYATIGSHAGDTMQDFVRDKTEYPACSIDAALTGHLRYPEKRFTGASTAASIMNVLRADVVRF